MIDFANKTVTKIYIYIYANFYRKKFKLKVKPCMKTLFLQHKDYKIHIWNQYKHVITSSSIYQYGRM